MRPESNRTRHLRRAVVLLAALLGISCTSTTGNHYQTVALSIRTTLDLDTGVRADSAIAFITLVVEHAYKTADGGSYDATHAMMDGSVQLDSIDLEGPFMDGDPWLADTLAYDTLAPRSHTLLVEPEETIATLYEWEDPDSAFTCATLPDTISTGDVITLPLACTHLTVTDSSGGDYFDGDRYSSSLPIEFDPVHVPPGKLLIFRASYTWNHVAVVMPGNDTLQPTITLVTVKRIRVE